MRWDAMAWNGSYCSIVRFININAISRMCSIIIIIIHNDYVLIIVDNFGFIFLFHMRFTFTLIDSAWKCMLFSCDHLWIGAAGHNQRIYKKKQQQQLNTC